MTKKKFRNKTHIGGREPVCGVKVSKDRAELSGHRNRNKLWACGVAFCDSMHVEKPLRGQARKDRTSLARNCLPRFSACFESKLLQMSSAPNVSLV